MLRDAFSDVRIWVVFGVILALLVGPLGPSTSTMIIIVLMAQMTLSMEGLTFNASDLRKEGRSIVYSIIACFGINTVLTLFIGSLFIPYYPGIWEGWVLLAAVPCAVSVVTMTLYLNGNVKVSVLSSAVIYLIALGLTPAIVLVFLGESVDPLKILQYVVLFIAIPMILTIPLKRIHMNREVKRVAINAMMFLLILFSLGYNREYVLGDPVLILVITVACVIRIFVVGRLISYFMKRRGVGREKGVVYLSMAVWKNSGLSVTLCMILFLDSSVAVIPCIISLLVELLWFTVMMGKSHRDRYHPTKLPIKV